MRRDAVVVVLLAALGSAAARLSPVRPPRRNWSPPVGLLSACRAAVLDVQPFVLVVVALSADPAADRLLRPVHDAVGTATLLVDRAAVGGVRMDVQVALMVADGADDVAALLENHETVWDQMSHYFWLVPAANRSEAAALFRFAWRRRKLVNAVLVAVDEPLAAAAATAATAAVAYTYNPFNDTLAARPVDADELRDVDRQRMTDLNGHPVRICMFPTRLKAVKQPDGSYKGTDGMVVSTLAKHMNFTPVYSEPSDGRKYGWAENISESDFAYTGLLGDLVHNVVDMAFNGAFLKAYHSNNSIRYTAPVMFDELCFVVPMAQQMSQWRAVFTAFDIRLWYFLAATFAIALGAWTYIRHVTDRPFTLDLLAVNLFRVFLMGPLNQVPKNLPERLMILSTVLFGFITATSLQAVMVKYLSYPKYERNLATMQEVYDTGMPILVASTNIIMLFEMDDNPLYVKLSDRFVMIKNKSIDILTEVAHKRKAVGIGRKNDVVEKIASSHVDNNKVLLHIVEDCARSFHIVYLVRRDVPFMNVINRIITTFVESGIVNSWFMHAKPFRPITDYHHRNDSHGVFTMDNVVIAFLCLAIGLAVSSAAFVAELVYYRKFADPRPEPPPVSAPARYPRMVPPPLAGKRF